MKKLFLVFAILIFGLSANASSNLLHTIILEGTDDGYNIVLKVDSMPTVKKNISRDNKLALNIKGVTASNSVNAIYRSTADVNNLVVETVSDNELNVYIQAKDIAKSTILAQVGNEQPVILSERFPLEKVLWSIAVLVILGLLFKSAKSITEYENSILIRKDIKDREIELYKNFQNELSNMPRINRKINSNYAQNVMPRSRRNYKELARM